MSIVLLKHLKNNDRYGKKQAFFPTGADLKILIEAIQESNPSADLKYITGKGNYKDIYSIPLTGKNVQEIVEAIVCPSDDLKYIIQHPRYGKKSEYILTGKQVKILVEAIEDVSCLVQPVYRLFTSQANVGDVITVPGQGDNTIFVDNQYVGLMPFVSGAVDYGGGLNLGPTVGWVVCETEPQGWLINASQVLWQDMGEVTIVPCQTITYTVPTDGTWYLRYTASSAMQIETYPMTILYYNDVNFATSFQTAVVAAYGLNATSLVNIGVNEVTLTVYNTYHPNVSFVSEDGLGGTQNDATNPCP